jgi:N utilization substance protein B
MALCAFYGYRLGGGTPEEVFAFAAEELDDPPLEGAREYGLELLAETVGHREWAEKLIESKLENWDLDRVTFLDRLILELALSEMVSMDDVPAKVSISEAIEIAKIYSTDESPSFVNGILDAVYHDILDDKLELPVTG